MGQATWNAKARPGITKKSNGFLFEFTTANWMPANHKVDDIRQVAATFVPGINFWAFYSIRKLQKYLVYVVVPQAFILAAIAWYGYYGAD